MKKKILFILSLGVVILAMMLSGCGSREQDLEGKYIVTFELNGGILNIKTSEAKDRINYAYEPSSHLLDPSQIDGYKLTRTGYDFEGWYKTAECNPADKWDFSKDTITSERITLYAKWTEQIVYSFTVSYLNGEETVTLGSYRVTQGQSFNDYLGYAKNREGFTPVSYYTLDANNEKQPADASLTHPGGATATDIRVYVDYIEGEWTLVTSFDELSKALKDGDNVRLMNDIDCGGKSLPTSQTDGTYNGTFEGNGYSVKNLSVNSFGTSRNPQMAIFASLGENAQLRNVSFTDVAYSFKAGSNTTVRAAAIAVEAKDGCKIENVSVTGKLTLDYAGELPHMQEAYDNGTDQVVVENFSAQINVETVQA